jgi:nucleotide-binding universal stress UspA family protein
MFLKTELRDISVRRIVLEGDPAGLITAYAASERPGLIMMPTRGCSAFRRFLLGSVAAKVLHDVNCPVWTSSHVIDGRAEVSVIPKVIVCAVELGSEGDTILRWASDLAADLEARLIVAHAIPSLVFNPETYYLEADMRRALIGDARASISKTLESSRTPGAEVRVEGGNVSTVVRAVAEDSRADLLIIGRASSKSMLGRLRTHSYALIRESPCPVISV